MLVALAQNAAANGGLAISAAHGQSGEITTLEIGGMYETIAEAEAVAARFPKSIKIKGTAIGTSEGPKGWVSCRIYFTTNKVTGERNEASISRATKFFKAADKMGIPLFCDEASYSNAIVSRENIEKAIMAR